MLQATVSEAPPSGSLADYLPVGRQELRHEQLDLDTFSSQVPMFTRSKVDFLKPTKVARSINCQIFSFIPCMCIGLFRHFRSRVV